MGATATSRHRAGFVAGLLAVAAGEITAAGTGRGRSPLSGLIRGLIDSSPAMLIDGGVALVGFADKPSLAVSGTGVSALAAAGGGTLAARHPVLGAAVAAFPHAFGGGLALRHGDTSARDTVAAAAAGMLVSATAITPLQVRRRTMLATAAAAAAAVVAADRHGRRVDARLRGRVKLPTAARPLPIPPAADAATPSGVAPLLAQPRDLVVIDINVPEPRVDLDSWGLDLDGDVHTPLTLPLADLLAMPLEERDLLMVCVHNPVGGSRMGCARWTGVGVDSLLEQVGVTRDDGWLVAEAVDGYTNVIPLDMARDQGFLAVGMAGQPLTREHGSPARLLVSGRHGQDGGIKWLRRLTVTAAPQLSYWGRRGWMDGSYPVQPASRIDTPAAHARVAPGEVAVRGYAWAPPVGVEAVQLRVDDGEWTDADLGVDLGPDAWRPWTATWHATPGRHRLYVRCRTAAGEWQEEKTAAPYPHGVRGIHAVTIHVGGGVAGPAARRVAGQVTTRVAWAARSMAAWNSRAPSRPPLRGAQAEQRLQPGTAYESAGSHSTMTTGRQSVTPVLAETSAKRNCTFS